MRYIKYVLCLSFLLLLAACSNEPQPEDRMEKYVQSWNKQDYAKMYDYLSTSAKKEISKKEFTERYKNIYEGVEAKNLKVTYTKPKEEKDHKDDKKVSLPFNVKMDTMAGPISFKQNASLVKEEKEKESNWYVNWKPGFIFADLKKGEKVSVQDIPAVRGEIVDRNGKGLALNSEVYEISMVPQEMEDEEAILDRASQLMKLSKEEIRAKLNQSWVKPGYAVPIISIPADQMNLAQELDSIPSVYVNEKTARVYPYKEAAAHLIGYIGSVTAEDLERLKDKGYTESDVIGKRGLEELFQEKLKGESGARIVIQDKNKEERVLKEKPAKEGEKIQLTIDAELQKKIFATYKGDRGSAAAIQPKTGETLALVSSPSFDPNKFILGMSKKDRDALDNNKNNPTLNRFSSLYAPGSTMKPLTAAVALQSGIDPDKTMNVSGLKWQKSKSWGNYYVTRVHDYGKPVNMKEAMVYSDNIYFAQQALNVGKDKFTEGLKKFGFEEKLPYDYPIPGSKIGALDNEIQLADSGYGQAQIQMSTLHLAAAYTPFVNEGNLMKPSLLLNDPDKGSVWKEKAVDPAQAAAVLDKMKAVIQEPKGTGHSAAELKIPLAGKTGTAEIKQKQGEKGTENGWFVVTNPEKPEWILSMVVESVEKKQGSMHVVDKVKSIVKAMNK
ncbi:penicillin-binding transpeptidase domain-containing protein [Peribacillus deserti]|uniref:serine-type D-Ala-D-Ala carboxypeptidase n=1 Tax=Peribacillus deserti TaxID=673318 RepID=A0A2N5MBK9_9BACI|nr:penicillin-binding transpeptidase domain-containing protein [Peribacillus deserti]PLT31759.1 peptidoglycan glycosyltransferase [Peribacillus deserti]